MTLPLKRIITIAIVVSAVLIGGYIFIPRQSSNVELSYIAYAQIAKQHDDAAYRPGTIDNPLRYELNQILSEALIGDINNERRLTLAKEGLSLLKESEQQIDVMGDLVPSVTDAIANLEDTAGLFSDRQTSSGVSTVVLLARERLRIISDIRGLSYRANFHTEEIFKRIVEDGGALTADHALFLNNQIPLVELQFDERSNLYIELQNIGFEIERMASHFE